MAMIGRLAVCVGFAAGVIASHGMGVEYTEPLPVGFPPSAERIAFDRLSRETTAIESDSVSRAPCVKPDDKAAPPAPAPPSPIDEPHR